MTKASAPKQKERKGDPRTEARCVPALRQSHQCLPIPPAERTHGGAMTAKEGTQG